MKNPFEISQKNNEKQEGGVENKEGKKIKVDEIPVGEEIHIQTEHTRYILESRRNGFYLSGHPKYCPTPTKITINGSTWGGSALQIGIIAEGMHLEFNIPGKNPVTTSVIQKIETGTTQSFSA